MLSNEQETPINLTETFVHNEMYRSEDEMIPYLENSHLYSLHEMQTAGMTPLRMMANATKHIFSNPLSPLSYTDYGRHVAAASELVERITKKYPKPEFGIKKVEAEGKRIDVEVETLIAKPFCNLLHFKRTHNGKEYNGDGSKLLVVAPMSGHHATLLRGTVQALIPHHDVYITDWLDAREVAVGAGKFDLNDYIDYLIEFIHHLGPNLHTMAVCQPSVPLYAAVAVLNEKKDKCAPKTMTLMGGPVDTRKAPTEVNRLAKERSLNWFESHVITRVPINYPGFMRRVYPGFLQLTGFMSMNMDRHIESHINLFKHLIEGDGESAAAHRKFYNEYLSVCDLPADFYLQTIVDVFKKHALPKGEFKHHGELVKPEAINKTAILAVEGELDDISGVGQTKASLDISTGLAKGKKKYHLQKNVGHYGIFNGRRYREHVRPVITDWIKKHD
ncbi:MAG: polyhydroxyalkanoate depolymerase [Rickettsiales bacterium]|nr:polyhydroxyalkanoate depolymerase [Rickettsiales bacterium]